MSVKKSGRLPNFEIIRVIAMFLIVVWHCITHGLNLHVGQPILFDTASPNDIINYILGQAIMSFAAASVDLYILVTGYFVAYSESKWNKILPIWTQVCFYSVAITLFSKNQNGMQFHEYVDSFMPILNNKYWFVTQYIGLIAISPFLACLVKNMQKREFQILLLVLMVLNLNLKYFAYSVYYSSSMSLPFFIFLFLIGAYIRQYNPFVKKNMLRMTLIFATIPFIFAMAKYLIPACVNQMPVKMSCELYAYNSITFFTATSLFIYIKNLKFTDNVIVRSLTNMAPYMFGIYLIHDNGIIRDLLWNQLVDFNTIKGTIYYIPFVLGYSITIFSICIIVDFIRVRIFQLLKVDMFVHKVNDAIAKGINRILLYC